MKPTRRDLLAWAGGACAGLAVTPVPWKVLDDVSIWTQNWPWIPQPRRGAVETKLTSCTLCPNACGLRVRMAAGAPVGVAGMTAHPVSRGALCPLAFGAHQLNWHPARLRSVLHRGRKSSWEDAASAFRKALREGAVAVVDGRPGRAGSAILQQFAQAHDGTYAVVRAPEEKALGPYERWSGVPAASLGYDFENARTVVSFGAPLLDGWGTPGRFTRWWAEKSPRLVQVESAQSRTAACAWRWVAIRPGADAALAAGLARVWMEERLVAARGPMPAEPLESLAPRTGLTPDAIRELARTIVQEGPALVISADDNPPVAALNVILGTQGIVARNRGGKTPQPVENLSGRVRAVLIDSTVPWDLVPNVEGEVFRFAAWHGGSPAAEWLLPAPGFLETLTDVPTPPASVIETYAVAAPLLTATEGTKDTAGFLAEIDGALGAVEDRIKARCAAIYRAGKGIAGIESADKLYEALAKGVVWAGEKPPAGKLRFDCKDWPAAVPDVGSRANWTGNWRAGVLPPLASKLFQESSLREAPARRQV